jgi:hypothetical protein
MPFACQATAARLRQSGLTGPRSQTIREERDPSASHHR